MTRYKIRDLRRHQHYSKRNPPWVKLHRDILTDRAYCSLPDSAWRLGLELLLLASRTMDGLVSGDPEELGWQLRHRVTEEDIRHLSGIAFIEPCERTAGNVLAPGLQHGVSETEAETKTETKTETKALVQSSPRRRGIKTGGQGGAATAQPSTPSRGHGDEEQLSHPLPVEDTETRDQLDQLIARVAHSKPWQGIEGIVRWALSEELIEAMAVEEVLRETVTLWERGKVEHPKAYLRALLTKKLGATPPTEATSRSRGDDQERRWIEATRPHQADAIRMAEGNEQRYQELLAVHGSRDPDQLLTLMDRWRSEDDA